MIKYALLCSHDHDFEAWFSSSDAFDDQVDRGLVECPHCADVDIRKALMAPNIAKGRGRAAPAGNVRPEQRLAELAGQLRDHIRDNFDYVGPAFADEVRAMHADEKPSRPVYGETTAEEHAALVRDELPVAPLPDMLVPRVAKKLN
ncbi:DUF1178 family protein [Maricaulis sp. CAU 1757]